MYGALGVSPLQFENLSDYCSVLQIHQRQGKQLVRCPIKKPWVAIVNINVYETLEIPTFCIYLSNQLPHPRSSQIPFM